MGVGACASRYGGAFAFQGQVRQDQGAGCKLAKFRMIRGVMLRTFLRAEAGRQAGQNFSSNLDKTVTS